MSLVVGGVVPTEDVVGRVRESNEVLASLPHSGAVLVGDRRHGKTSLSRLVQRLAADQGAVVVSVSAERETYAEFVSALISELARLDPAWATELAKIRLTLTAGPVRLERDSRAAATLDDLLHRAIRRTGGRILALFIDEVSVLARNHDRLVTGQELLHEVWGPQYSTETNYLRVYLAQLRRKLEPTPARPRHLVTEPGIGYRFEP